MFPCTVLAGDTDHWTKNRDQEALMTNIKTISEPERPPKGSLEELYQDIFMTMLMPYIDKAVDNYYEKTSDILQV